MMVHKKFVGFLSGAIMALAGVSCSQERPNVVLIVIDDLGYADLGFLPNAATDVGTPNIDALAKKATYFSRAYATAPICSPSRAGLITGRYQQRWGNYWYGEGGLPENEKTLPQFLRDQGYYTAKIGKTHLNGGAVEHPLDHGYDHFLGFLDHTWDYLRLSSLDEKKYGTQNAKRANIGPLIKNRERVSYENGYTTDIFSRETIEIIENKKDRPFFIHLSYNAVHHPTYVGHPDYLKKYGLEQFPFWNPDKESFSQWHRKWGHLGAVDPNGRNRYLLQLEVLDDGIGRIVEALKKTGQMDNTIIVLVSDNGGTINTYAKNQPLSGYKYMFGEGGIRIPMLWHVPNTTKAYLENPQLVSNLDILPTILDLVGIEKPANLDGKSLLNSISDPNENVHDALFWSNGRDQWVATNKDWKLAHNTGWEHLNYKTQDGKQLRDTLYRYGGGIQLYKIEEDISESVNRAKKNPEMVDQLTKRYWAWRNQMSDPKTAKGQVKKIAGGYPTGTMLPNNLANVYSNGADIDHYAAKAFDGDPKTFWQSKKGNDAAILPYYLVTEFDKIATVEGLELIPVQSKGISAIKKYSCYGLSDHNKWEAITTGKLPNDANPKRIPFSKPIHTTSIKLHIDELYGNSRSTAIGELKWTIK